LTNSVTWAQLLPDAPIVKARDGRQWTYQPRDIIAAFAANKGPLAVDYEHAQDLVAPSGRPAPAAGWITEISERAGSVWGKIEWTARAAEQIADKSYRFLSPSISHDSNRKIVGLAGAALVNRPALYLKPLDGMSPDDTRDLAVSLAREAQVFRTEQAALGRNITISEAVEAVARRDSHANRSN